MGLLVLMNSGCNNLFRPPNIAEKPNPQEIPLKERVSVESLESSFAKALWHQISAAEDLIKTVENYVDIPEQEIARTAGGKANGLQAIGKYLPSDLSTLKRTKIQPASGGRAAGGEEEITITLQDELDEIIANFNCAMSLLVPN